MIFKKTGGLFAVLTWFCALTLLLASTSQAAEEKSEGERQVWLETLGVDHIKQGWGQPQVNLSVGGTKFRVAGENFARGVGTHSFSGAVYELNEGTQSFSASVGVSDDQAAKIPAGTTTGCLFKVIGDGKLLWESGVMKPGGASKKMSVPLDGVKELRLIVEEGPGGDAYDHANWMDASFLCAGKAPTPKKWSVDLSTLILTPKAGPEPRINGAKVIGGTPGKPFLFRIPTTGKRPIEFAAVNLPAGLVLDKEKGILSGTMPTKGTYRVTLHARNAHGKTKRELRIVSGDTLALTPPMGWNSWYCWSESISAEKVKDIAQAFVDRGLADHGWTYVNIDDCWQGVRGGELNAIQGNERFPDMKELCEDVHAHGLKIGIYSTPWIGTYAGFIGGSSPNESGKSPELYLDPGKRKQPSQFFGSYPGVIDLGVNKVGPHWFCDRDAQQWAEWGFDYVKYDWKPNDVPTTKRLLEGLQASGRDIVYSLSNDTPFENAKAISAMANLWRTGHDIRDEWGSIVANGFNKTQWLPFNGPGHWNDPDMLQVGSAGVPNQFVRELKPTRLTPDEQYAHMSLWCLMSAPLLISCDVKEMDDFTYSLLTNDEVIAVNQDPMGLSAKPITPDKEIWGKVLENGTFALGLFNLGAETKTKEVTWKQLNLPMGKWKVRDLWRQKDLETSDSGFSAAVNPHGVVLVTLTRVKD